ncbi:MAG: phosphate ABC transporter substrate-binding protein PstS, partial [Gemmatimonadaceae bacterium]|nr:phosphate ABC transporter substrate-binding protein PstS [Gemmatimonadaceae bacterium]
MHNRVIKLLAVALLASAGSLRAQSAAITGAGSSFAYPIYSKWAAMYAEKTGVEVNYQSIGSSGGIRQLSEQTVDFGGTDGPMTDAQMAGAKGGPIMHIPTVLGAVAIIYNVPGVSAPIKLTGDVLADVFLGKITKWNDAPLHALNPGLKLPAQDIIVT